jgi:hypothetical protein
MNAYERARIILDSALNAPNAYAKVQARKLLAFDTNTPGWWTEVDRLREHMDQKVGTSGGPMWETPLVPQVLAHKGFAADSAATTTGGKIAAGDTYGSGSSFISKYLTGSNFLVFAAGLGIGGALLYWYFRRGKKA